MTEGRETERAVLTSDGRSLTVELSGSPTGRPVFLLHGTPGSRNGPRPRSSVLYRLGVQLISYDRPGYGGSTRRPGRTVADAADDVATIATALGIETFAVVGRSGGGPHALACAALLGPRVTRTAVLVSLAPADAEGLDWFGGMTDGNVREYSSASADALLLAEELSLRADAIRRNPETLLHLLQKEMTGADRRVVGDVAIRRLLTDTYREALRQGPYGWVDDVLALRSKWGFALESIEHPVLLWHGADDNFSPASHTEWLYRRIPNAEMKLAPGAAHFGAVEILPDLLGWVAAKTPSLVGPQGGPLQQRA